MFRKTLFTTLAVAAVASAPAAAKPADVFITNGAANPVPVAGTVGLDPAANGVTIANAQPIPVAPVSSADAVSYSETVQLDPDQNGGQAVLFFASELGGKRFESTYVYVSTLLRDGVVPTATVSGALGGTAHANMIPLQATDVPGPLTQWHAAIPAVLFSDTVTTFEFKRHGDTSGPANARIEIYGHLVD